MVKCWGLIYPVIYVYLFTPLHQYTYSPNFLPYISWGAGKENLFNKQELIYLVIIPCILVTSMFDSGVILWGEIRSSSLSGGVLGFSVLRFWLFLRLAFRSLCQKTSVFPIWVPFVCDLSVNYASPMISNSPKNLCMLHLSPLHQIDQGFDHKDVEIFKTVLHAVFGFDPIFLR